MQDGFVLWEGNAIVRYLARKYSPGTLWPSDMQQAADVELWMSIISSASCASIFIRSSAPTSRRHNLPITFRSLLAAALDPLEAALADRPYLAGPNLTVADIPLGINVYRWFILDVERPRVPDSRAWYQRLRQRPAFQAHIIPPGSPKVELKVD